MANGLKDSVVPAAKLRAWWAHRQWLAGSPGRAHEGASPAEVLAAAGWARSVGGAAPYLGLFARAGLRREAVDAAVADLEVHELPSARGCTYVLPASDYALGLAAGAGVPESEIASAVKHLGVTRDEIEKLCLTIGHLLSPEAPLEPAAIREVAGGAVRSLGETGRKRGVSTTLPLALGLLQARGQARRVPVNGRLDQQRYGYVRWDQPVRGSAAELAERYLAWAAPAAVRHLRWFTGFTAATAKAALAPLDLVTLPGTDLLLPTALAEEFEAFEPPAEPSYALVAGIDGIHLLHRDLPRLLDPADAERTLPGGRAGRSFGTEADPQTHVVVDRGRIVGLWEYDPGEREIVHQLYVPMEPALQEAIDRTEEFVREDLGDARGFSLDSPKSRAPRIAALRAAAG
ncbi:winged helix DNA-binding domain-containing protein [Kitasatospora sp. DSM 101779]|uniref:winged helix DNA-binding domain-containing protein n=1 Tax=Kitasatospora sp. DSM 101779 TaxID=2853165 RepID=UPI0021D9D09A|nr:winged helix DNA-binding domain-containing protein [Kitasatospora sp. DSM 101779]MCU7823483.1 winged helix DNA-binding domain-containing protein [Kitasatospora sp. DSM 101779]